MHLSLKGLTIACALVWAGCLFFVGMANLVSPYGGNFLQMMSSVYPGFHASRNVADVLIGTGYALVDGAIAGFVFGWLYNLVS